MSFRGDGELIDGVVVRQTDEDPNTFEYFPLAPGPDRDADGEPVFVLVGSEREAFLQLGIRWSLDSPALEALRAAIAERHAELRPLAIRLVPARAVVSAAALLVGDGRGGARELAWVVPTSAPSFTALFRVDLDAAAVESTVAALSGQPEFLLVRYEVAFERRISVEATIEGDARLDVAALRSELATSTAATARARIERALAEARLTLRLGPGGEERPETGRRVVSLVSQAAAERLLSLARGPAGEREAASFRAMARIVENVKDLQTADTDIGTWFPNGDGLERFLRVPDGPPHDGPFISEVAVRLGFDPAEAPLAFVEVSCGAAHAIIGPPRFDAVVLPSARSGTRIAATAHFAEGGPPFRSEHILTEDVPWELTPGDLGLTLVELDGTQRREAGARELRVLVRYTPRGGGVFDERVFTFLDEHWTAAWFVITRNPQLAGTFEVEASEKTGRGVWVRQSAFLTEATRIVL